MTAKHYRISAHLLCHDVRLSARIERTIDAERPPDPATSMSLLDDLVEDALRRSLGDGCPYELSDLKIEEVGTR